MNKTPRPKSTDQRHLIKELEVIKILVGEDPCKMPTSFFAGLRAVLQGLLSRPFCRGFCKDKLAQYYGISYRTLERWQKKYEDFPKPFNTGTGIISYDLMTAVEWKLNHPTLFPHAPQ